MLLTLSRVSLSYTKFNTVLDQIDLQIRKNEFIGITGKAGCGKTTLLETIGGLHKPDSGQVLFQDRDIYSPGFDKISFRRRLQVMFQFPENQFFETDVWSETAFGPKMLKLSPAEAEEQVRAALAMTGLADSSFRNKSPFILSGGQKRRLALACALAVRPEILLLDEPFSGLDAEGREQFTDTLKNLHTDGMTILMVSHDPDILCELSDRIIVLSEGKIVMDSTPGGVYTDAEKCAAYGIGQPSAKQAADLSGINLAGDYSYTNFLNSVKRRLKGTAA